MITAKARRVATAFVTSAMIGVLCATTAPTATADSIASYQSTTGRVHYAVESGGFVSVDLVGVGANDECRLGVQNVSYRAGVYDTPIVEIGAFRTDASGKGATRVGPLPSGTYDAEVGCSATPELTNPRLVQVVVGSPSPGPHTPAPAPEAAPRPESPQTPSQPRRSDDSSCSDEIRRIFGEEWFLTGVADILLDMMKRRYAPEAAFQGLCAAIEGDPREAVTAVCRGLQAMTYVDFAFNTMDVVFDAIDDMTGQPRSTAREDTKAWWNNLCG